MIVVGLMSGTSADGIDAAVLKILGVPAELEWTTLAHIHQPYSERLRAKIFAAFDPESSSSETICLLNAELGEAFARAALEGIAAAGLQPAQVDLIGSHGQTIWHAPSGELPSTLQIGDPAIIAERTGLPVISSFRSRDMAAGGQGAPLVPYVDALLLRHPILTRAVQNIGGIANITYLPPLLAGSTNLTAGVLGFDTGPGNMLIDDAARRITNGGWTYDQDGKLAAQGNVNPDLLAELLAEPYLHLPPPKTTGRELFGAQRGAQIWQAAEAKGIPALDVIATLTAFTAQSIGRAYADFLPVFPDEIILSGEGARNPFLVNQIQEAVRLLRPDQICRLTSSAEIGLAEEVKEAAAFAILAYESWHHRPGNLPSVTGARRPVILGNITPGGQFSTISPAVLPVVSRIKPTTTPIPITETRNPATIDIDTLNTLEMVRRINHEDQGVALAVERELPAIAQAIDAIAARMQTGGRLIYLGAGTSGRLGVLDASECPPTFNTPPGMVIGLIAGGLQALTNALEGAEDDRAAGRRDLEQIQLTGQDSVLGIAASGGTPYVQAGLEAARQSGALTISLVCALPASIEQFAQVKIRPLVGPEVITGSTRLKAGSAQKMVLNMISTGVMIRLGKTFGNLMVDVQMNNNKLRSRARRIVAEAAGLSLEQAAEILDTCGSETKTAIVASLAGVSPTEARRRLAENGGVIRKALLK